MAVGCKNTSAINFDGTATEENYSCVYLKKNQGNCHWFEDVVPDPDNDKTFTLSYSIAGQGWVFFHDYAPDMYIHSRENLFNAKNSQLYHNNYGNPGLYNDQTVKKPFFIDVVFNTDSDILLESVNWITEYLSPNQSTQPFNTLTHISIWNSNQHSGRITLNQLAELTNADEIRKTKGEWNMNNFRDILITKGTTFLMSIFKDYALDASKADVDKAWYRKELLIDTYFCIRFEFDNSTVAKLVLHETTIQAQKSIR